MPQAMKKAVIQIRRLGKGAVGQGKLSSVAFGQVSVVFRVGVDEVADEDRVGGAPGKAQKFRRSLGGAFLVDGPVFLEHHV